MTTLNKKAIIILLLFLPACSAMPSFLMPNGYPVGSYKNMSVNKISSKIKIEYDSFENVTEYTAPKFDTWAAKYYLHGLKNEKTKKVTHRLIIPISYSRTASIYGGNNPNFYIIDSKGKKLKYENLNKYVNNCSSTYTSCNYSNNIAVILTSSYLRKNKNGFFVRIKAKKLYDKRFEVPANYVQAYLLTIY